MKFLLLTFVLLLSSCGISTNGNEEGYQIPSKNMKAKYFLYGTKINNNMIENHFIFIDENYKNLNEIEYDTDFDIFYSALNNTTKMFYMFGNGGLFEIDLVNSNVNKINDFPITSVAFEKNSLYYYINGGYTETGYDSKICNVKNSCISLNDYVYDFIFIDNKLYVSCDGKSVGQYSLKVFENRKEVSKFDLKFNINSFHYIGNDSFGLNPYGMYKLESNNFIKYYLDGNEHYITATDPIIKEVNDKIYIVDNDSNILYEARFKNERIELSIIYKFDKYYFVYPSLEENRIVLVSNNNSIEVFDLKTMEIELVNVDLTNEIDYYHAIEMED